MKSEGADDITAEVTLSNAMATPAGSSGPPRRKRGDVLVGHVQSVQPRHAIVVFPSDPGLGEAVLQAHEVPGASDRDLTDVLATGQQMEVRLRAFDRLKSRWLVSRSSVVDEVKFTRLFQSGETQDARVRRVDGGLILLTCKGLRGILRESQNVLDGLPFVRGDQLKVVLEEWHTVGGVFRARLADRTRLLRDGSVHSGVVLGLADFLPWTSKRQWTLVLEVNGHPVTIDVSEVAFAWRLFRPGQTLRCRVLKLSHTGRVYRAELVGHPLDKVIRVGTEFNACVNHVLPYGLICAVPGSPSVLVHRSRISTWPLDDLGSSFQEGDEIRLVAVESATVGRDFEPAFLSRVSRTDRAEFDAVTPRTILA